LNEDEKKFKIKKLFNKTRYDEDKKYDEVCKNVMIVFD